MNMHAISQNPVTLVDQLQTSSSSPPTAKKSELPFASLFPGSDSKYGRTTKTVALDVHKIATGEADNLQAIAANIAKADLSFRFLMEMRDKLISSYQEVMRMQV